MINMTEVDALIARIRSGSIDAECDLRDLFRAAARPAEQELVADYIDDLERHGTIDHAVAFEIKRRLSVRPAEQAEPLREVSDEEAVARHIVTKWIGMFDPPPQIDFQQSELLQGAIGAAIKSAQSCECVASPDRIEPLRAALEKIANGDWGYTSPAYATDKTRIRIDIPAGNNVPYMGRWAVTARAALSQSAQSGNNPQPKELK